MELFRQKRLLNLSVDGPILSKKPKEISYSYALLLANQSSPNVLEMSSLCHVHILITKPHGCVGMFFMNFLFPG
ncbi:hypothetical protein PR048_026722 [Dryococelus australis]|uniref:Uncharacterized protein n=1 Tax=Dryococelus australis TaxID=614101 RepID=A0ABQ9GM58_9NEOP|nr:hypothetical protein PR048_026722 [Dryococelus australis]